MFGGLKLVPLSDYINGFIAGKSLAGEGACENRVLKTSSVSFDVFKEDEYKFLPADYSPNPIHVVNVGDVLISRMNTVELVGACAYVQHIDDNVYLPDRLWKVDIKSGVNPIFIWQTLIQEDSKRQIRSLASGTSGSMKNISKKQMMNLMVPQASCHQQEAFSVIVEQADKSKFAIQKSIEKLETLKNSLMQEYFG